MINEEIPNMEDVTLTDDTSINDTSINDTSINDTSTEDTNIDNTSTEDTSVDDTSVDNTSVDDTSVDNTSVADTSVDDDVALDSLKPVSANSAEEDAQARNFKALRDHNKELERELQRYKESLESFSGNQDRGAAKSSSAPEEDYGFSDDDLIEGRQLKQILNRTKQLEAQQQAYLDQQKVLNAETKLKNKYSDFDNVLNEDNLAVLKARDPELMNAINNTQDWYSKGLLAYTAIKDYKIAISDDDKRSMAYNNKKINRNISKPGVGVSASPQRASRPLSKVNDYIDDYSDDALAQHAELMRKRASGG